MMVMMTIMTIMILREMMMRILSMVAMMTRRKLSPSGSAPPHTSWQILTMSKYGGHDDDEIPWSHDQGNWMVFLIMRQKCHLNVEEPKPTIALDDDEGKGQNWHSWEVPMKEPWMKFSDQSIGKSTFPINTFSTSWLLYIGWSAILPFIKTYFWWGWFSSWSFARVVSVSLKTSPSPLCTAIPLWKAGLSGGRTPCTQLMMMMPKSPPKVPPVTPWSPSSSLIRVLVSKLWTAPVCSIFAPAILVHTIQSW